MTDLKTVLNTAFANARAQYAREQALCAKLRDMSRNAVETYNGFQSLKIGISHA